MINADGSGFVNLTNQPEDASWGATWSPDATQIVFNSARGGAPHLRLWVMNADGSDLHPITTIWGEYPAWSPDGRLLAFMSNRCACNGINGEGEYDIYTVHPDGTGLRRLTSWPGHEGVGGGWSPDGKMIAYNRNPDVWPGIWIMTRDGRQVRRLQPTGPQGVHLRGVEGWAPDGSFIVFGIRGEDPATAPSADYWVSSDGRSTHLLVNDSGGAQWRPAGAGKVETHLTLEHRLIGGASPALELTGHLTAKGHPAAGRQVIVGRLGQTLPTKRLRTVTTNKDGSFTVRLALAGGPLPGTARLSSHWRAATAFYPGSDTEWSTAAFEPLQAQQAG